MKYHPSDRMGRLLLALERDCKKHRGRQKFVAYYCDCSVSTVSDWLYHRKKPTGEQVLALLDLLSVKTTQRVRRRNRRAKAEPINVTPVAEK